MLPNAYDVKIKCLLLQQMEKVNNGDLRWLVKVKIQHLHQCISMIIIQWYDLQEANKLHMICKRGK